MEKKRRYDDAYVCEALILNEVRDAYRNKNSSTDDRILFTDALDTWQVSAVDTVILMNCD